jgi:hypothetical protein
MFNKKNKEQTALTQEVYEEILQGTKTKITELKVEQNEHSNKISQQLQYLRELRAEYKQTGKKIKLTKRALKEEKRKLHKTDNKMRHQSGLITKLNKAFITEGEKLINVDKYKGTKSKKKTK